MYFIYIYIFFFYTNARGLCERDKDIVYFYKDINFCDVCYNIPLSCTYIFKHSNQSVYIH